MLRRAMTTMAAGAAVLSLATACPQQAAGGSAPTDPGPADTPAPASAPATPGAASMPGQPAPDGEQVDNAFLPPRPANDAQYSRDPDIFPRRLGIKRIFLQADKINHLRDPQFIPGTHEVLAMAKVGGLQGLWRLPADGSTAGRMVFARPLYTPGEKADVINRGNWYVGTPAIFPDGKHAIFGGTQFNPRAKYGNVLGIAPIKDATGTVSAVTIEEVTFARTPDVHPDGKTIIFASCTEIRKATLNGRKTQTVTSEVVVDLKRLETKADAVCTVNRPRFSPDGSQIVFEVNGQFLHEDLKEKHKVPLPVNDGEYLIEPWIANMDGTGVRRLIKDSTYERDLRGRLQSGGSKDPSWFPDGKKIVFSHGRQMAAVTVDGEKAKLITVPVVATNRAVKYIEGDPAVSSDGTLIAIASDILGTEDNPRPAPSGVSILDLSKIDLSELE